MSFLNRYSNYLNEVCIEAITETLNNRLWSQHMHVLLYKLVASFSHTKKQLLYNSYCFKIVKTCRTGKSYASKVQ